MTIDRIDEDGRMVVWIGGATTRREVEAVIQGENGIRLFPKMFAGEMMHEMPYGRPPLISRM